MQNKIVGGRRFSGYNRTNKGMDPRPGSLAWYKANMPNKLNDVAANLSNGLGIPMDNFDQEGKPMLGALERAAIVLSWSEKPLAHIKFDNHKCTGCGTSITHSDKPFPKWDLSQKE